MPNADGTPTVQEAIDALKNSGGTTDTNAPSLIGGFPKGYAAKHTVTAPPNRNAMGGQGQLIHPGESATSSVPARYFNGDEWQPGSLSPNLVQSMQLALIRAGLIDSTKAVRLGVWDQTSANAYKRVLEIANGTGVDAKTALFQLMQNPEIQPQKAPLPTQVTSAEDLKKTFRSAFIDTLGQNPGEDRLSALATMYQQVEANSQQQLNEAQQTGAGGVFQAPPSADVFAADVARRDNPKQAMLHDVIKQGGPIDTFENVLAKWS